jgi:tetratricopeptide (TPR) repeat protein
VLVTPVRLLSFAVVIVLLVTGAEVLAQSNPFDGLDTRGRAYTDPALYAKSKAQWLARVEAMPDNVDVLEGAADFFIIRERPLAAELFERARALEPNNPKWLQRLSQLHRLNAASGDVAEARLALSLMERANDMSAGVNQAAALTDLPAMAFDAGDLQKARAYAERLLREATSQQGGWNYGNAVHKGNLILGRIAAAEGRLADAVTFLRAAGETPGSPQLNSFGPNMTLAKDLLERGERDAVLAYFEACRVFWKMGGSRLDSWIQDVQAGSVPNFGANLRY